MYYKKARYNHDVVLTCTTFKSVVKALEYYTARGYNLYLFGSDWYSIKNEYEQIIITM